MSQRGQSHNPLILLLEDDARIRDLMTARLEKANYECVVADVAEDAFQIANLATVDALVCDLAMRGLGGLWMIETFARRFPGRPIVVTTGAPPPAGSADDRTLRALIPPDRILHKPFRMDDLVTSLNAALGCPQAVSAAPPLSPPALDVAALLGAMDGVCYVVGRDGRLLHVGEPAWSRSAAEGNWVAHEASQVTSMSLFDGIRGDAVRETVKAVHERVLSEGSGRAEYTYCCNGPDIERRMHMIATPVRSAGASMAVLYQSRLLEAKVRPPVGLFDAAHHALDRLSDERLPIVTMCSYCQLIAWPIGHSGAEADWIEAPQYYRQGGSDDVRVSHGVCPNCYVMLMDVA